MDKIKEAANNIKNVLTDNTSEYTFIGETSEGIKIRITQWKKYSYNIGSAFPEY